MLKLPIKRLPISDPNQSQTFPEGKGVETAPATYERLPPAWSQTFPEGKGVETAAHNSSRSQVLGRRPSQKVKVLKP